MVLIQLYFYEILTRACMIQTFILISENYSNKLVITRGVAVILRFDITPPSYQDLLDLY